MRLQIKCSLASRLCVEEAVLCTSGSTAHLAVVGERAETGSMIVPSTSKTLASLNARGSNSTWGFEPGLDLNILTIPKITRACAGKRAEIGGCSDRALLTLYSKHRTLRVANSPRIHVIIPPDYFMRHHHHTVSLKSL